MDWESYLAGLLTGLIIVLVVWDAFKKDDHQ